MLYIPLFIKTLLFNKCTEKGTKLCLQRKLPHRQLFYVTFDNWVTWHYWHESCNIHSSKKMWNEWKYSSVFMWEVYRIPSGKVWIIKMEWWNGLTQLPADSLEMVIYSTLFARIAMRICKYQSVLILPISFTKPSLILLYSLYLPQFIKNKGSRLYYSDLVVFQRDQHVSAPFLPFLLQLMTDRQVFPVKIHAHPSQSHDFTLSHSGE